MDKVARALGWRWVFPAFVDRLRAAWADRGRDPLDEALVCRDCRVRYVFEERKPRPCWVGWPLLATMALIATGAGNWFKHQDVGAAGSVVLCVACIGLVWFDWSAPCRSCRQLRFLAMD